jgi:cleavage and polyadenylation specificity factor subunit 3
MINIFRTNEISTFDKIEIIPLGAGCEVGRSCIVLRYRDKTVMFDCGLHQGKSGTEALPILNSEWFNPNLSEVNVMLISHFHNDHCAAVPYVVGMTKFQGRIFMTHPTKAIYFHVLKDYIQIAKRFETGSLYNIDDLERSLNFIEVLNFHQIVNLNGIKVCAFMAGHVLGAAMFHINIYGFSLLYTGDYSRETDRHMPSAELPDTSLNLIIVESTYGVSNHLPRSEREEKFIQTIIQCIVHKKGKVLLPIVALGRAQEILLILEQFWEKL